MARDYGDYAPTVPVNVTWEETIVLADENDDPIDLTNYHARSQIYAGEPVRDADTGLAVSPPLLELTTTDYYTVVPDWPVYEGWSIPTPTNGAMLLAVPVAQLWLLNPTNARQVRAVWDVLLVNKATGYAIPVVKGRPIFKGVRTL